MGWTSEASSFTFWRALTASNTGAWTRLILVVALALALWLCSWLPEQEYETLISGSGRLEPQDEHGAQITHSTKPAPAPVPALILVLVLALLPLGGGDSEWNRDNRPELS